MYEHVFSSCSSKVLHNSEPVFIFNPNLIWTTAVQTITYNSSSGQALPDVQIFINPLLLIASRAFLGLLKNSPAFAVAPSYSCGPYLVLLLYLLCGFLSYFVDALTNPYDFAQGLPARRWGLNLATGEKREDPLAPKTIFWERLMLNRLHWNSSSVICCLNDRNDNCLNKSWLLCALVSCP